MARHDTLLYAFALLTNNYSTPRKEHFFVHKPSCSLPFDLARPFAKDRVKLSCRRSDLPYR